MDENQEQDNTPSSRKLVCWGSGNLGQHGQPDRNPLPLQLALNRPIHVPSNVTILSCGASFTVVATDDKEVLSWGCGQHGQLGNGKFDATSDVESVHFLTEFKENIQQISCGGRHTCFVMKDGEVFSCGAAFVNEQLFHLGNNGPMEGKWAIPRPISCQMPVSSAACGQHHTLFLLQDGQVAGYGRNMYGQLGLPWTTTDGNSVPSSTSSSQGDDQDELESSTTPPEGLVDGVLTPTIVPALANRVVVYIAAGANHSICITDNGELRIWGYGRACGLLQGNLMQPKRLTCSSHSPTESNNEEDEVAEQEDDDRSFTSVCGGHSHTLALTNNGRIYVLGSNSEGQLGLGESHDFASQLTRLPLSDRACQVNCGENYSAAITDNGQLLMWGKNSYVIDPQEESHRVYYRPQEMCQLGSENAANSLLDCGTWHAALWITDQSNRPRTSPKSDTEESSEMSKSNKSGQDVLTDDDGLFETQRKSTTPVKPMMREKTRITLNQFYAPTPKPKRRISISEEDETLHGSRRKLQQQQNLENEASDDDSVHSAENFAQSGNIRPSPSLSPEPLEIVDDNDEEIRILSSFQGENDSENDSSDSSEVFSPTVPEVQSKDTKPLSTRLPGRVPMLTKRCQMQTYSLSHESNINKEASEDIYNEPTEQVRFMKMKNRNDNDKENETTAVPGSASRRVTSMSKYSPSSQKRPGRTPLNAFSLQELLRSHTTLSYETPSRGPSIPRVDERRNNLAENSFAPSRLRKHKTSSSSSGVSSTEEGPVGAPLRLPPLRLRENTVVTSSQSVSGPRSQSQIQNYFHTIHRDSEGVTRRFQLPRTLTFYMSDRNHGRFG